MKKKWQLIKEAYDRYPKGTVFTGLGEFETYGSTGTFDFDGGDIFDLKTKGWVYYSGIWADIGETEQKPDLLDGKVAIRVNDEHEFKALMKHYEENDWKCDPDTVVPDIVRRYPTYVRYENFYGMAFSQHVYTKLGYEYVNFPDFAANVGIEVRKPLLRSEDNVDLFGGENYHGVRLLPNGKWKYDFQKKLSKGQAVIDEPDRAKAFTNSESAEAWVNYHNLFKNHENN